MCVCVCVRAHACLRQKLTAICGLFRHMFYTTLIFSIVLVSFIFFKRYFLSEKTAMFNSIIDAKLIDETSISNESIFNKKKRLFCLYIVGLSIMFQNYFILRFILFSGVFHALNNH